MKKKKKKKKKKEEQEEGVAYEQKRWYSIVNCTCGSYLLLLQVIHLVSHIMGLALAMPNS